MLAPQPKATAGGAEVTNLPSYTFNGPINTTAQGNPVPLGYGRMIVGSAVISAGITADDYDRMLGEQRGRCAVCESTDPGHGHKVFVVDHDHVTNHVRALLCRNCNSAIGLLQDDPKVIAAAAAYVKRHRQMPLFT